MTRTKLSAQDKLNEGAFASQVEDFLKNGGWTWTHFRPALSKKGFITALSGNKGYPDYTAVRYNQDTKVHELVFIELKGYGGKLSPEQEAWIALLSELDGVRMYVWYPRDYEEAMEVLWRPLLV